MCGKAREVAELTSGIRACQGCLGARAISYCRRLNVADDGYIK
jgi:hypothetical protein